MTPAANVRILILLAISVPTAGVAFYALRRTSVPLSTSGSPPVDPTSQRSEAAEQRRLTAWTQLIEANFAGDQACADCHTEEYQAHQRSGHSHTATPMAQSALAERIVMDQYVDPLRDQTFEFALQDGQFFVHEVDKQQVPAAPVSWLLGSGTHAQTPIFVNERTQSGVEFRWSYLAHEDALGVTPDHARFQDFRAGTIECYGRPMDAADVRSCLACHTTHNPPPQLPIQESLYLPNVGCERCHGPRKQHVVLARQGRAAEVPPLVQYETPDSYLAACSQCHRDETSISPEASPHELVRFQPYGLKRSRCYLESAEKMTCSACHDPHDAVSQDRASYITQCQQCHQQDTARQCTARPRGDCIECHMPAVEWTAGIAFHDHWIRIRDDEELP